MGHSDGMRWSAENSLFANRRDNYDYDYANFDGICLPAVALYRRLLPHIECKWNRSIHAMSIEMLCKHKFAYRKRDDKADAKMQKLDFEKVLIVVATGDVGCALTASMSVASYLCD